jgi:hypothetical protein
MLQAESIQAGSYRSHWSAADGDGRVDSFTLGEFICDSVKLARSNWHKAAKRHESAIAKAAAKEAKAKAERFKAEAIRWADMPDSEFRNHSSLRDSSSRYRHDFERIAKNLRRFRLKAGLGDKRRAKLWQREKRIRFVLQDYDSRYAIATRRSRLASLIRFARQWPEAIAMDYQTSEGALISSHGMATARDNLRELVTLAGPWIRPSGVDTLEREAAKLDSMIEPRQAAEQAERERERAERAERLEREARERAEREAASRAAWLAGDANARPPANFSRDDGTPYLRIVGEELQTSWGANVPLAHAVKVFRFVKLCKERGEGWARNGRTIRVGHFQVDSIQANGDFVAGCHRFAWAEVERAAIAAGVADIAPADDALEPSRSAA